MLGVQQLGQQNSFIQNERGLLHQVFVRVQAQLVSIFFGTYKSLIFKYNWLNDFLVPSDQTKNDRKLILEIKFCPKKEEIFFCFMANH